MNRQRTLELLSRSKPELRIRFGVTRLALFGSSARAIKGKAAKFSDLLARQIDVWLKGKRTIGMIDGKGSPRQKVVEHPGNATIAHDRHRDGHSGKMAS